MRKIRAAVFASIAALAAAGIAVAASHDTHIMKVDLPDGSVARVEYKGDVAPKVTVAPALNFVPARWFDPFVAAPFTMFDRIAAEMDRQTEMMMQQMHVLTLSPNARDGKIDLAALGTLPAGTVSYSFMSTGTSTGMCSRSFQITSFGPGRQPKVISNSSGDCHDGPIASDKGQTAGDHGGKSLHAT